MKRTLLGQHNSRYLRGAERTRTSRVRFSRGWSLRGCILDLWHLWLGAAQRPEPRRRPVRVIRYFRELRLDDWAVLCDLCGKPSLPNDNPHLQCIAYESWQADRPSWGAALP